MSLTSLWISSKDQLIDKHLQQIIMFAGNGKLRDESAASNEFRDFISHIPSEFLARYADNCLQSSFSDSGIALQDIVNQIGERLGFNVHYGRYRGRKGFTGNDGLWIMPNGHGVVVEVKTTDAYRIDLNTIAKYRNQLVAQELIDKNNSSMLIVVGRKDTGDLEAQIRGSRHAWDIRLISIDALVRLMHLKESLDDTTTISKIHEVLIPQEFTRLDRIVDLVFSATEDIQLDQTEPVDNEEEIETSSSLSQTSEKQSEQMKPANFHSECVIRIEKFLQTTLIKRSRTKYSSPNNTIGITLAVSKLHDRKSTKAFWFAFHPAQRDFLLEKEKAFITLGCGSEQNILVIPYEIFQQWLDKTFVTDNDKRFYWHIRVLDEDGKMILNLKRGIDNVDITEYCI